MSATAQPGSAAPASIPDLGFAVCGAGPLDYAAAPTILFRLRIESLGGEAIRSVLLDVQIQIAARRRAYDAGAQQRLGELFGAPERWGTTLRTLPWTRTTVVVPPFEAGTEVELPVACTYDLEVVASRYFDALGEGTVPLEFLFSGTVFYGGRAGMLQTARIAWEKEAEYDFPVAVWRQTMERHFPQSAWVRLGKDSFDRLAAYRSARGLGSWDATLEALLPAEEER